MRIAISGLCIKKGCVLMVRKKKAWILPGGKPKGKETELGCLLREFGEELPMVTFGIHNFYRVIRGQTPHTRDILEARVWFGEVSGEILPGAEVNAAAWINVKATKQAGIEFRSDLSEKIVESLISDGYL